MTANPPQYMRTLTTRDSTRPTQAENPPSRPKAPSPASAPPAMNPAPSTARKPAARGIQRQNVGSWLRADPPHRGHHHLGAAAQLHAPVGQPDQPDGRGQHVPRRQLVDVVLEVGADHGELAKGRVDDVVLQRRVPVQDDAHPGDQHQQQREHGEEGGIGDLSGQPAGLIVGVLADDGAGHGGGPMPLLELVDPGDQRRGRPGQASCRPPIGRRRRPGRSPTDEARPAVPRNSATSARRSSSPIRT